MNSILFSQEGKGFGGLNQKSTLRLKLVNLEGYLTNFVSELHTEEAALQIMITDFDDMEKYFNEKAEIDLKELQN